MKREKWLERELGRSRQVVDELVAAMWDVKVAFAKQPKPTDWMLNSILNLYQATPSSIVIDEADIEHDSERLKKLGCL